MWVFVAGLGIGMVIGAFCGMVVMAFLVGARHQD